MNNIKLVGVGGLAASRTPGESIKTFALGSCVAVIMLHPPTRTVGMVHVALPDSAVARGNVGDRPGYFADTGIPVLLKEMAALGCSSPGNKGMIVKLAGGAKVMDPNNVFNVGKRNILAIRKILWSLGMGPVAEDVEGSISRTVTVAVDTGQVTIASPGKKDWQI
ncbi:MAG: chemotaxis protein CheD [Desulfobulbaceae bacterium]|nr:chemotaxis protein CheD [Desulfobulbaceae bacterium]